MLIIVAGIKRSGSTVQLNLVRIALEHAGYDVKVFGQSYKPEDHTIADNEAHLVKIHPFRRYLAENADHIFLTDRNDEEILASLERFTGNTQDPKRLKEMRINLHLWSKYADFTLQYKDFMRDQYLWIIPIKRSLKLHSISAKQVLKEFNQIEIPDEYDPVTCLFPNHITKE